MMQNIHVIQYEIRPTKGKWGPQNKRNIFSRKQKIKSIKIAHKNILRMHGTPKEVL